MRVLLLGGTGAIGIHLVNHLANKGVKTVVTSRRNLPSESNLQYVQGNAHDFKFVHTLLKDHWDVLVDLMVYTTPGFKKRVNLLLDATSQYIYFSSARVYADSPLPIVETSHRLLDTSEDETYLSTDEYALTKARQEDLLRGSGRKNWTIVRPYITYSEKRLQLGVFEKEDWLYRALNGRSLVLSKDMCKKLTTLTYGGDVAKGITALVGDPQALGEIFHITSGTSNTWEEVLNIYLNVLERRLGSRPKVLLAELKEFSECHPAKYQIVYDRLYNRQFENSKISDYINIALFKRIDEGLGDCLNEFLNNPHFKSINWKKEALRDRISKERTPLKEITSIKQKLRYLLFRYL